MESEIMLVAEKKSKCLKAKTAYDEFGLMTEDIVKTFGIGRTQASRLLNELVKKDELIKINIRPVRFISRKVVEEEIGHVSEKIYRSFKELYEDAKKYSPSQIFDKIIGYENSLKEVIEQIKISVFYPENGLPIMLSGETGVGKTFMAQLIHEFCVSNKILKENAPYNVLNCAQYYNNPELLSSLLFGHAKGAFTGANESRVGLIEKSNEGILFLDEVHSG